MHRLVLRQPAPIESRPLTADAGELPEPGRGQLRVKVLACGVCHTDLHTVEGEITPPAYPIVLGHQVVGTVEAIGDGVTGWAVGDRAGVAWLHAACGTCSFCRRGEENLCPQARFTGFHTDGGYADATLAEAAYTFPMPMELSDEQAAPLLCAGIIGFRSLRRADVSPGETVGLIGFGASAHLAIQVARAWNCTVYVFSRGALRRQLALELGAAWAGTIDQTPPAPLDRAVIFAPAGDLVPVTLSRLRPGGTLAINAIHMSAIPSMPYTTIYGERTLRSVTNATRRDGTEFLDLAAKVGLHSTVVRYALDDANQALLDLKQGRLEGAAVLIP
jgi:propanol-preferring alcohol dehydrogenase